MKNGFISQTDKMNFLKKISAFMALPFSIKRKVMAYYLHRVSFSKASDNKIIWTSFFYFTSRQPVRVKENENDYQVKFRYQTKPLTVVIRKGESSDIYVFFQVFIRDEYNPFFTRLSQQPAAPETCLDAGANVGYFALASWCWFPGCKVVSVEPDTGNYAMLLKNVQLNNLTALVLPIQAALWVENKNLFLKKNSLQEWAYAVTEEVTPDGACNALTLSYIVQNYTVNGFDAIKIDVEGAEQPLFNSVAFINAMQPAKVVGLEIHDEKADREKIQGTLCELGYVISNHGELTLATKK